MLRNDRPVWCEIPIRVSARAARFCFSRPCSIEQQTLPNQRSVKQLNKELILRLAIFVDLGHEERRIQDRQFHRDMTLLTTRHDRCRTTVPDNRWRFASVQEKEHGNEWKN